MIRLVGAVTIGQAPRPDLLEALRARLPEDVEVIEAGALDGLTAADLPIGMGAYPLTTRMRDGQPVTLDETFLAPRVQAAIEALEAGGAAVTLLLCAGGFGGLRARGRLVRPFEAAADALRLLGARRIGVVVPIAGQAAAAERKWRDAGFEPVVVVGSPASPDGVAAITGVAGHDGPAGGIDALVLDFVGHPAAVVDALRRRLAVPLVDLGEAGADAAAARFR